MTPQSVWGLRAGGVFFQWRWLGRSRLRQHAVALSLAAAALFAGLSLSMVPANAQCTPDPASSGQKVTCSGVDGDGFAAGVGVNNLTVNVLSGAVVNDNGSASITVNDSNTVTNSGTLAPASGLIGISAGSFNAITNNVTITVVDGTGISAVNSNIIVNNSVISASGPGGGGVAISVFDNNTITNNGSLSAGTGGAGIFAGINNTISNWVGASITVGDDARGIYLAGGNNRVSNAGAITVGNTVGFTPAAGIFAINSDNTINNVAGGTISVGQNAAGIFTQGDRATIGNAGTINANDSSVGISVQGDGARITNSGSITAGNSLAAGIALGGSNGIITNTGAITAGNNNSEGIVVFGDSNTIINRSSIIVGSSGVGIDATSFLGSNSIVNTGTITVGTGGTGILVSGSGIVFNSGKIDATGGFAAIDFCGCGTGNLLTLGPGSNIIGQVFGTGSDTFQLGGTGKDTFNLSLIGAGQQYDGFSTFNKVDSSNWAVTGTGNQDWNVLGGTLSVNGTITGAITVNAGGTLGGTGTVGNTLIDGGTLAPGNSVGTLNVSGNLVLTAAATYLVEISGATSDLTNVTGAATLGGTVVASIVPGSSVLPRYTIMQVGSHSGDFSGVSAPGGLVGTISFDPNNVYLNFALDWSAKYGLNINQRNVANALQNFFNANGSLPGAFAGLSPAGLTQVSGELGTGTQQATFDAMNLFIGLLTDPFIAGRNGGVGGSAGATPFAGEQALAYAGKKSGSARDAFAKFPTKADVARNDLLDNRWSVWGAAFGGGSNTDGNAVVGSNTATARAFGFAAGADFRISRETLAGFALAGGGTNFSVLGTGPGRSDMFQAGAFVRHNRGAAYVTAAAAWSWQDVTTDRTVTVAGFEQLRAQFNANAITGRIEGGYRYVTPWMGVTPYVAGQFTSYFLPSYAEQVLAGAGTFALNYAAKDVTTARTELGVRLDRSYAMQTAILTLRGRLAWAHDFYTDRSITPVFQTLPGTSFTVYGAAQPENSALTTVSAEANWLNGWSAAATFEGQFSDVSRSYAGKGVVRYAW